MRLKHISTITLLATVFCAPSLYAQKKVDASQKVTLRGILKNEMFYGAPGFGESPKTDAKEPTYILHLYKAILFRDAKLGKEYELCKTIQVRYSKGSKINGDNLVQLTSREVEIECTLYGAHNGHHHAPAVTEQVFSIH